MKLKLAIVLIVGLFRMTSIVNGATIIVPVDQPAIQLAIDQSVNGDTVLVQSGTYYENINFRGKNIKLGSYYMTTYDTSYIGSTIIDGSHPLYADTGSCVIINSGEDTSAALIGFTLMNGTGTLWTDIHGAGIYREGGGILIELSSPTIMSNLIIYNQATDTIGAVSAGGGGIRIGDGNPIIRNNVIAFNQGKYGPGIVMNYAAGIIRNNVISTNTGGQQFYGGSGMWILGDLGSNPKIIENNTIVNNSSTVGIGSGGILTQTASNVFVKNCIVYDNFPSQQIKKIGGSLSVTYSNVGGNYTGMGNFGTAPLFLNENYLTDPFSNCIDHGDSSIAFNDIEVGGNPGVAEYPSLGTIRNDVGAYGGPWAMLLPSFATITGLKEHNTTKAETFYYSAAEECIRFNGIKAKDIRVYDLNGRLIRTLPSFHSTDTLSTQELSGSVLLIRWVNENGQSNTVKVAIR